MKRAYYKGAFRVMIRGVPQRVTMKLTDSMKKMMRQRPDYNEPRQLRLDLPESEQTWPWRI